MIQNVYWNCLQVHGWGDSYRNMDDSKPAASLKPHNVMGEDSLKLHLWSTLDNLQAAQLIRESPIPSNCSPWKGDFCESCKFQGLLETCEFHSLPEPQWGFLQDSYTKQAFKCHQFVVFFHFQVPQIYKVKGYEPFSVNKSSTNYRLQKLARPLKQGAEVRHLQLHELLSRLMSYH